MIRISDAGMAIEFGKCVMCQMPGTFGVVKSNLSYVSAAICGDLQVPAKRICSHVLLFAATSEAYLQPLVAICSY